MHTFISSAARYVVTLSRFEYNFLFILAAGGLQTSSFSTTHDSDFLSAACNYLCAGRCDLASLGDHSKAGLKQVLAQGCVVFSD
jgi:hypothetical protein